MTKTLEELMEPVEAVITDAKLVAFDGCHKIYLAMDDEEATWFRLNYNFIVQSSPDVMLQAVTDWYEASCLLRFVSAVRSNPENPNEGFTTLVEQGADADDEDEDEYDEGEEDE